VVVFRGDEDVAVEAGDLLAPAQCDFVLRRRNVPPEETTFTMIERITTAMADLDSIDSF
jgi:hypothetical protein